MTSPLPLVLCLSGHDPTGGAGLHADIEAVAACGGHALSIITAHTVQDTSDVLRVTAVPPLLITQQIETLANDCAITAVKIGLLGDAEQIPPLVQWIKRLQKPVVFDPVLRAGGGSNLASAALIAAITEQLLPWITLLTPNAAEARRLAPKQDSIERCAQELLDRGCKNILITGGDEASRSVINTWHAHDRPTDIFEWPRLPETFHGAGCTLAAACAAFLAQGLEMGEAIQRAQTYTQRTLHNALSIGQGRRIPGRRA
jgi:hydroxymethylpyrimidine/phosphomethylpyrimidine kinase